MVTKIIKAGFKNFSKEEVFVLTLTPRNIFFAESNPAAYILAVYGGSRSTSILHANRDIVLCVTTEFSDRWSPGTVSMTTKSIGDSEERPIWNMSISGVWSYCTMIAWLRFNVYDTECWWVFCISWKKKDMKKDKITDCPNKSPRKFRQKYIYSVNMHHLGLSEHYVKINFKQFEI